MKFKNRIHVVCFALLFVSSFAAVGAAEVEPFRTAGGRLGFLVPGASDPSGLRLMVDIDGPAQGWSEWGVDRMMEGPFVFRYPAGETEWRWEHQVNVTQAVQSNQLALVLSNTEAVGDLRWYAEWYDGQWNVIRRFPAEGIITNAAAQLPPAPEWLDPPLPDISELMAFTPTSLSRRVQHDFLDGDWTPLADRAELPILAVPGYDAPVRVKIEWTDARSGQTTSLQPESVETDGARTRWHGRVDSATEWWLISTPDADGALDLVGVVRSDEARTFRFSVALEYPAGEWIWHDDMQTARPMDRDRLYTLDGPSPYGLTQRRSYYPFGVISSGTSALIVETNGREPRHFQIEADPARNLLAVHYDLAVTPLTGHFPGLATVNVRFRAATTEGQPFREALQSWYARDPDWQRARVPVHGLWLPFTDIASISNPADFGFAFFEKVGPHGSDVAAARSNGVLTLVYTEPWLYWLPLADPADWNLEAAGRRMEELARTALGKDREFASAGILGATRDAHQTPRLQFLATPWSTGARMEVITDPELPTTDAASVNRAMAEWRFIRESLEDPRVDGIYLDSMSAMETIDYQPNAIAVADYPCTFVLADLKPGVATPIQAVEFTAALAGYLRSRGLYLMGNFPCWKFPFFMPYIDIPGEETTWYSGRQYVPLSDRERNYRRAISGSKPFGFLQATHFSELSVDDMEKYFRDCLALGLLPSFFSHDGANDPYWVDATLYERDRSLFRRYLPLTIRLSAAGWQPLPAVERPPADVGIEQFGATSNTVFWLTLRNTGTQPASGVLRLRDGIGPRVLYEVASGRFEGIDADAPAYELEEGEVSVWLVASPAALEGEAAWFRRYASNHPQYHAGAVNLASGAREWAVGLQADLDASVPMLRDEATPLTLTLTHVGDAPMRFVRWVGGAVPDSEPLAGVSGESLKIIVPAELDARAGRWVHVRWRMEMDGRAHTFERIVRPPVRAAVVFEGREGRYTATNDVAELVYAASNRSAKAQTVLLRWFGDLPSGSEEWTLAPGERRVHRLRVEGAGERARRVAAQWQQDGQIEREHEVHAIFAEPLRHLGTMPGVRVTADSTYSGYTTAPLHDGVVDTAGLIWHEAAYASAETSDPHWIRYLFPSAQTSTAVTAYWNAEGGVAHASQRGEVWGLLPDGGMERLGSFDEPATGRATRVSFPATLLKGIEWRQPSSGGSVTRPNLLWVVELEVE